TRFAMRFLNPIRTSAERHYLKERVVLSLDSPVAAMRVLLKRLKENKLISITALDTGLNPVAAPFMDGEITVATGAPDLAFSSGATLIPMFSVQTEAGEYVTTAETPIILDKSLTRHQAAEAAVRDYAGRLEKYVLAHPGQWVGWINV
ncbi:MAG: hypothetical protein OEY85_08275, partial [Rhodospirillales bacterium]|nr:hypothetical protein [Rhodospirillales bacterium]